MANLIDLNMISGWRGNIYITPADAGYLIVPMYRQTDINTEIGQWITENVIGHWSWFRFGGSDRYGTSYCFELEADAFAFKLRFI